VDLLPTLLELLELPVPEGVSGRSLAGLARGAAAEAPEYVFVEAGAHEPSQIAVRKGPWKLVHFRAEEDRRRYRVSEFALYHLERDPDERRNVIGEQPELASELREALRGYEATASVQEPEGDELEIDQLDEQTREQLRALGYIEGGAGPLPEGAPAEEPRPTR